MDIKNVNAVILIRPHAMRERSVRCELESTFGLVWAGTTGNRSAPVARTGNHKQVSRGPDVLRSACTGEALSLSLEISLIICSSMRWHRSSST